MRRLVFVLVIPCLLLSSCIYSETSKKLDLVESQFQTKPDSCLAVISSINLNSLRTRKEKARYALLKSAVLDKNYIDVYSDSLITIATDYYSIRNDPPRRMMANYYLGLIQNRLGEYPAAIITLEKAEKDALDLDDHFYAGLIFRTKGDIFSKTNNNIMAIDCHKKAVYHFSFLDDLDYAAYAELGLAYSHINNQDYDNAERILDSISEKYNNDYLNILAKLKRAVICVEKEKHLPDAITVFQSTPKNLFEKQEYGYFALALEYQSLLDSTNKQIAKAYELCRSQTDSATIDFMHAEILHLRGNDSEAYRLTRKAAFVQDSLTRVLLQQSVSNAQRDYYKAESQLQEERAKRLRERNRLGAAAAMLASALLSGATLSYRKRKEQEIKEQMLNLSIAQAELRQAEQTNASLLGSLFSEKLHHLDMISEDYVRADSDKERIAALREFKEEIAAMRTDEDLFVSLEKDLDRYCDGVMSKLRKQIPSIKGENLKLITLFFAGLPYSTVQLVMNRVSIESLKMTRSRFRKEIKAANAPDEALFIKLLEMKSNRSVRQDK